MSDLRQDPACWQSEELQEEDWLFRLDDRERAEIGEAVERTAAGGVSLEAITRESFELPSLSQKLQTVKQALMHGRGFAVLRGLDLAGRSREEVVRAFLGIGSYFGTPRPQNAHGHLLGHVYDLGDDADDPATRIYRTAARQRFHVDSCDIVGLLCLAKSARGGQSLLCSSLAIVETIERTRPDLLDVLRKPFVYDRKGEIPEGKGPTYEIPIVHEWKGVTSVFFARDFIESAQRRFPGVPRLTDRQREALDVVERVAESPAQSLGLAFEPGDIQLVHNHVILHARAAYVDGELQKRHLLRLWLSAHQPRPLPPVFEERYGPLEEGRPRGGIVVPGIAPSVPLEPE